MECNICFRRVLKHSLNIKCTVCKTAVHIKCLSDVTRQDPIYRYRDNNNWICTVCIQSVLPFNHFKDDDDFIDAVCDINNMAAKATFNLLHNQNKMFSPFDLNFEDDNQLHDPDQDINIFKNHCTSLMKSCDYYLEDSFNSKLKQNNISDANLS